MSQETRDKSFGWLIGVWVFANIVDVFSVHAAFSSGVDLKYERNNLMVNLYRDYGLAGITCLKTAGTTAVGLIHIHERKVFRNPRLPLYILRFVTAAVTLATIFNTVSLLTR